MKHGDQIALVDGNYPASAHANKLIRADGIELIPCLDLILDILPIDNKTDAIVRAINIAKVMELIQFTTILKKPAVIITSKQSRWTLKAFIKGLKMHLQL